MGLSPFGRPDAGLVAAVNRAGALGVLDAGGQRERVRAELARVAGWATGAFGVRVTRDCELLPRDLEPLAGQVAPLILGADLRDNPDTPWLARDLASQYHLLVEVTTVEAATDAVAAGAAGLIAVGCEAAGRVGELSSFVLLQRLLAEHGDVPVWVRGGVGTRMAVAAVVGGARGVVLDTQLSLLAEADGEVAGGCRFDGETVVVAGYRVQVPPAARITPAELDAMSAEDLLGRLRPARSRLAFVPMGQDGFLATRFAKQFGTVARAVRAVRAAVTEGVGTPDASGTLPEVAGDILSADSPLCQTLGLRRPVAQGPMTRVSDTPSFAKAVADDGALPFLALAMANRATASRLLHETRRSLGERAWGVGILGFAAPEVLAAQLEVIREVKPAAVIIAGGRPAQAESLEADGVAAFLHVPSPTLLRQYLEAGARRFIFEGTECGGHVGPLASFPLWEAQLGVLTTYLDELGDDPGEAGAGLQILFAGGVHDARSAAMVAAAAAQLAARGVAVGLLMGTSYLFTTEAVECGAILPGFQQQMIEAETTTLLQSAPGHLTRCVPSPFVELFERTKRELRARGTSGPDAWAELEALNVGRLRVASKGVERRGDDLVDVNVEHQLAEGLFMAGQVATARREVTTIARLHDSVTVDAARFLSEACEAGPKPAAGAAVISEPVAQPVDIAIVGMACVAPKSPDVASFWANVVAGVDAIEEVPATRWDPAIYYRADLGRTPSGEYTPSKWGGFLPLIPFDPLRYGIPPSALTSVEPVQFLALDVARKAMEDARLIPGTFDPSRTGVVFGTESNSDFFANIIMRGLLPAYYGEVPPELDEVLPKVTPDTFPGILANIIASRISNRFDLAGPAYVVDAACGSSLAALDLACKELVTGSADTVLCGGADLHAGIVDFLMFSSLGALSPTGKAKTFDASADGTTLAEAVACVVLKRLSDAERDGDRIYAVIKAVAGASDGRSLGLTAPRVEGQYLAVERTYRRAGISPRDVGLVEAHGTGTTVGDKTELESLTKVYTEAGAAVGGTQLGSVKSQIGHAKTAAGLIGLIKVALSVYHGVRPPTLHVVDPNPAWDPATSPFEFATTARPWAVPGARRVAALSAFGFGGANYHAVVCGQSDDVPHRHGLDAWPSELFLFRGSDRDAANTAMRELERLLTVNEAAGRPWRLRDLARTASGWADSSSAPVRVAVVAADLDELAASLRAAMAGDDVRRDGVWVASARPAEPGQLAFLFPGQGSQRPGMLADLFVTFPELQEYLRQGQRWADLLHPPSAFSPERKAAARAALTDTRVAQPALGIGGLAVHHLLNRMGIVPDLVAGHSYGELVALSVAGAYDADTLLRLSAQRGTAILDAAAASGGDTGTMAAVRATSDQVRAVLRDAGLTDQVVLANHNAPDQVVVSGTTSGVAAAVTALTGAGHSAVPIEVACAFHSPLIASAVAGFAKTLADAPISAPQLPVFSNRLAAAYEADAEAVRAELAEQVGAPVRFVEQVEAMYDAGARVFVEAGPGRVLTRLVSAILAGRPHTAVAVDGRRSGVNGLLDALAQLAVTGVAPRMGWLFRGRDAVDLTGVVPPRRPGWCIDGRAVVTADGQTPRGGFAPTRVVQRPAPQPVGSGNGTEGNGTSGGGNGLADDRRTAVVEFLRTSRDLVVQQRDVLLSYLGTPAGGLSSPPPVAPMAPMAPAAPMAPVSAPVAVPVSVPGPLNPSPKPSSAVDGGAVDVAGTVLAVICGSTGYPEDMIEPDLDLETDLSVDSIKRTEIAGILVQRLGASGRLEGGVAELTKLRSVRAITSWLDERIGTQLDRRWSTGAVESRGFVRCGWWCG
jgi:acyl transferase domain-containing protein